MSWSWCLPLTGRRGVTIRVWRRAARRRVMRRGLWLERLETRDLLSAGFALPAAVFRGVPTLYPTGYSPAQVRHAYGFDQINFGNVLGDGTGTTIAVVEAYGNPYIAADLHQFNLAFQLPDPVLTQINQDGGNYLPAGADPGWAAETALDVEWAHAAAPGANLLLVAAYDNSLENLLAAVNTAASYPGVVAVSMSWYTNEFAGEQAYDGLFTTPVGHTGVTFLAASGDTGAPATYPAASPNVVAVGGTQLRLDSQGNILSEKAWAKSGGGLSPYEPQPAYQQGIVTQSSTARANPDVALNADPRTGYAVYSSYGTSANGNAAAWYQLGGTSSAVPQLAGLVALADQGRMLANQGTLDGPTQTLPLIYSLPNDFHDITKAASRGAQPLTAGPGYDLVTGLGSPIANQLVADLVSGNPAQGADHFVISAPSSITAGVPFQITVTVVDASGNVVTDYTGTIHFTSSDGTALLPGDYTFTVDDQGSHTFTAVALNRAGMQTLRVIDTVSGFANGSATIRVRKPGSTSTDAAVLAAVSTATADQLLNPGINTPSATQALAPTVALPAAVTAPPAALLFTATPPRGESLGAAGEGVDPTLPDIGQGGDGKKRPEGGAPDKAPAAANPAAAAVTEAVAAPAVKAADDLQTWQQASEACFADDTGLAAEVEEDAAALPSGVQDEDAGGGKLAVAAVLATALGGMWAPPVDRTSRGRRLVSLN